MYLKKVKTNSNLVLRVYLITVYANVICCLQGPASISVSVPNLDEGNLRGQVLQIPVQSLSDTVGSLKEQIAGELQLPANKQKLSVKTSFLKDNLTLAYYNVGPGVVINLTLRERGGRKK
jgi:splicing factor 3A subunit 1